MAEPGTTVFQGFSPPPDGFNCRRPGPATIAHEVSQHFPSDIRIPDQQDLDMTAPDQKLGELIIDLHSGQIDKNNIDFQVFGGYLYHQHQQQVTKMMWQAMRNVYGASAASELLFFVAFFLLSVVARQMNVPHMRWSLAIYHETCRRLAVIMYDEDIYGRIWWCVDSTKLQEGYTLVKQIVSGLVPEKGVNGHNLLVMPPY